MKNRSVILSAFLIAFLFFAGWEIGISPLRTGLEQAKSEKDKIVRKMFSVPAVEIPVSYYTPNQFKIDILHYDLSIDLYPEKKMLYGEAVLTGVVSEKLERLDLNLYDNLNVTSLLLNNEEAEFEQVKTRLSVFPEGELKDTFQVKIVYNGKPKRGGLTAFSFGEINGMSLVFNLSEPNYASTWFPCNDMPDDKAMLDIKITNDSSRISASNGVLQSVSEYNGRKKYHWKTFYPISTYLICLYSSEYVMFTDEYVSQDRKDTMAIEYYVIPDHLEKAKKDFEDHPKMLKFFSRTFGEYPFIKEKYGVAEFLWQLGAMEHQTLSGIGSNFVTGKKYYNDIYVHELAHHWWGNAVGPKTWKDIWLNEGFATYSEALYQEWLFGEEALQAEMLSKFNDNFEGPLYNPQKSLFNQIVYDKGAWVLHMLRWELGDVMFFRVLREYFERYKYKSASTEDFKNICREISRVNLDMFFNQWVYKSGNLYLEYEWKAKPNKEGYLINIDIDQTQEKYSAFHFPLEVKILLQSGKILYQTFKIDARHKSIEFGVAGKPVDIKLDPNYWLLASISKKEP